MTHPVPGAGQLVEAAQLHAVVPLDAWQVEAGPVAVPRLPARLPHALIPERHPAGETRRLSGWGGGGRGASGPSLSLHVSAAPDTSGKDSLPFRLPGLDSSLQRPPLPPASDKCNSVTDIMLQKPWCTTVSKAWWFLHLNKSGPWQVTVGRCSCACTKRCGDECV